MQKMVTFMPKIKLGNFELYYEEHGNGEDIVILLHGFLSSSKMWAKNYIPDLMKMYKIYAVDLRGHGNSSGVKIGCNLQQMASDINKFVILKRINRCILMGMSMGGAVALQFAIEYPEKIKSLILLSPGPGTVFSKGFFILSPILSFISQKKFLLKLLLKSSLMKPLPRNIMTEFVDDAVLVSKETWLQYLHPNNKIQNFNMLKNFSAPSLIIIGERDKAINIKFQENIAYTIPRSVKVVMKNEGHAVAIENPNKIISEVESFLKG